MKCWNCGAPIEAFSGKLPFRSTCEVCHAALHCCRNCCFYKPGLPNDCAVPDTDYIADRTAINFCEEFKLSGKGPEKKSDPDQIAKRLFDEEPQDKKKADPKQRFDALFDHDETT